MNKTNITLIGMSGVGKSTIGKALADELNLNFIDPDRMLEEDFGKDINEILKELGDVYFQKVEEVKISEISEIENSVIAPGGSVIYSQKAMEILKKISTVVFLDLDYETLEKRVDPEFRGIVGLGQKSFGEIYDERRKLYLKYSEYTLEIKGKNMREIVGEISAVYMGK